jgi:hypothetical protein
MAIITSSDLKTHLNIGDAVDDTTIATAASAANDAVVHWCGRDFTDAGSATARVFHPLNGRAVDVDDFSTTTGLVVATDTTGDGTYDDTWDSDDFELDPANGLRHGQTFPFTRIRAVEGRMFPVVHRRRFSVEVTARWGWADVPGPVTQATLIKAARLFRRKDSPEGVAGFGDFGVVRVSTRDDPDVIMLLGDYVRGGGSKATMVA